MADDYLRLSMKDLSTLNRSQVWYLLVLFTAVSFTWSEHLNSIGILLLAIHWVADKNLLKKIASFRFTWTIIWMWLFLFLHFLALLWSHEPQQGWQTIQVKMSLLILPFLFSTEHYFTTQRIRQLIWIFSLSCCASFVYTFSGSIIRNHALGWNFVLSRMKISELIMHPGYYSNYFAFALICAVFQMLEPAKELKVKKLVWLGLILFLLTALLLLISKTAILFVACFMIYLIWLLSLKIQKPVVRLLAFVLLTLSCIALSTLVPSIQRRIQQTLTESKNDDKQVALGNSTGSRIAAWQNEWKLIRENWITGNGTGEANALLKKKFISEGYLQLANDNMHTHNQILHTWIDLGIGGVLLLFAMLASCFITFVQRHQKEASWLVILIFINLLTDDMLEIQAGIVFFVFFLCVYLFEEKEIAEVSFNR
jgi:O-antigen ligase